MLYQAKKEYVLPIVIFLIAFFYSSFFLQGLRLFDNDYNLWLASANKYSLSTVLWQVLNPILEDWNVNFRPFQTLTFKALFSLFEYSHSGYYYFKSFMLALFSITYFFFLRRYLNNTTVAALSALFISFASSTFTTLMWVSDFVIVSEFWALIIFAIFLNLETQEKTSKAAFISSLCLLVVLTLICDRTKANGKLIPGILFFYLILFDWRKLKRYGLAIVLMVVEVIPWKVLAKNPAPFINAKAETVQPYAWQPANLGNFWKLFGGDFELLSLSYAKHPPSSILAIIGYPILYTFLLALGILVFRRIPCNKILKFIAVWFFVNVVALMSYPLLPQHFQARYAISVLIPLVPLLLVSIYNAAQLAWDRRLISTLIIAVLVIFQVCFHTYHTIRVRNGFPTFMIATDTVREYIANNFTNSIFYYCDMPVSVYRQTNDGNKFISSLDVDVKNILEEEQDKRLYFVSYQKLAAPFLVLVKTFNGVSESLYDNMFNKDINKHNIDIFYLYRVVTLS